MIRDIRCDRGINGTKLAKLVHLSQGSVSKIETGKSGLPDWERLMAILVALSATPEETARVRGQFEIAQLDPAAYAVMRANGLHAKQKQFADLEGTAQVIRDFQVPVVPGLLQTPNYAVRVFRHLGCSPEEAERAATARSARQSILNDPRKRFIFIMGDAAVYSQHGAPNLEHWQQIDLLLARSIAHNVSIRILDSRLGVPVTMANPFLILDRRYVSAETTMKELTSTDPSEVRQYEAAFAELSRASLSEEMSREMLESRKSELGDAI